MSTILWVILPLLIAVGAAVLAVFIMERRIELRLASERQGLAEARAAIQAHKQSLDELDRLRKEATERKSADEFLTGIRTEQRRFVREEPTQFGSARKLVVQERIYFRSVPLSNWIERTAPLPDGADVEELAQQLSVLASDLRAPEKPQLEGKETKEPTTKRASG